MNKPTPPHSARRAVEIVSDESPLRRAMFWRPPADPALEKFPHCALVFWLVDVLRPRQVLDVASSPSPAFLAACHAVERLGLRTNCWSSTPAAPSATSDSRASGLGAMPHIWPGLTSERLDSVGANLDILCLDARAFPEPFATALDAKLGRSGVLIMQALDAPAAEAAALRFWRQQAASKPTFILGQGQGLGVAIGPDNPASLLTLVADDEAGDLLREGLFRLSGTDARVIEALEGGAPEERHAQLDVQHRIDKLARGLSHLQASTLRDLKSDAGRVAVLLAQLTREAKELSEIAARSAEWPSLGDSIRSVSRLVMSRWPLLLAFRPKALAEIFYLAARPGALDSKWYAQQNPDLRAGRLPPVVHYVLYGAHELRKPNLAFDPAWYLQTNPDVLEAGLNPFLHYLRYGRYEGRAASGNVARLEQQIAEAAELIARAQTAFQQHVSDRFTRFAEEVTSDRAARRPRDRADLVRSLIRPALQTKATVQAEPAPPVPAPVPVRVDESLPPRARNFGLKTILFIKNDSDLMTHQYRIYNYADALSALGYECLVENFAHVSASSIERADILVLCRIAAEPAIISLIARFKLSGRPVIFDVDDLVFDTERIEFIRHAAENAELRAATFEYLKRNRETLINCDLVTTSTFPLRLEAEKLGIPSYVVPNTISARHLAEASDLRTRMLAGRTDSRVRIGYFSGTRTHNVDFGLIRSTLIDLLSARDDIELLIVGELDNVAEFKDFGERFTHLPLMEHNRMLEVLATIDVNLAPLELSNPFTNAKSELKIFEAALYGIPTVASPTSPYATVIQDWINGALARSPDEWVRALHRLADDPALRKRLGLAAASTIAPRFSIDTTVQEMIAVYRSAVAGKLRKPMDLAALIKGAKPTICVIAILYNKAKEVSFFLESLRRQSYDAPYEIVLIDDASPDDSAEVVELWWARRRPLLDTNPNMSVRVLRNEVNLGNCGSRNRGIAQSSSDVVIIVDADCMFNRDFLSEHALAHSHGDCDAAMGPLNLETRERPPMSVLNLYEPNPDDGRADADLQDPVNPDSFVNAITRNFSIRRDFLERLEGDLFDPVFSYSAHPDSGFGWEDVEMGVRLYKHGARFKFLPRTASIHVSHPDSIDRPDKPLRSLKNFRRLHEKHPEISFLARQWGTRTHEAIVGWARYVGASLEGNADFEYLDDIYSRYRRAPIIIDRSRRLKVLTFRWHVPHQYELYKLGHEFTLATGGGTGLCESWEWDKRPMPANARMARVDDIDPTEYDVAILHFDENALRPDLCGGKVPADWGMTLAYALANWPIPMAAICHGTPQFRGQYDINYAEPDLGEVIEENRRALVDLMRGAVVVCNSHQARREWRFEQSTVIWHGFAPNEYPLCSRSEGVLTMIRAALTNRPHYNGWFIQRRVQELLGGEIPFSHLVVPQPESSYIGGTAEWAVAKYQNYVREIGRYGIYLNPTVRSPMPRSRGEAMMAGLASVNLRTHDVDLFVRNGENGFFADTAEELAEQVRFLSRNEGARERIGDASRRTAVDVFNQDRYLADWSALLKTLVR